jgi:hypothetical protein
MPFFTVRRTRTLKTFEMATFEIEAKDHGEAAAEAEDTDSSDLDFHAIEVTVEHSDDEIKLIENPAQVPE